MFSKLSVISKCIDRAECGFVTTRIDLAHILKKSSKQDYLGTNKYLKTSTNDNLTTRSGKQQNTSKSEFFSSHKEYSKMEQKGNKGYIHDYAKTIQLLNLLQSNTQSVALAKYRNPQEILPLFSKQLALAGITLNDLNTLNIIHISGTKGKGSTCAFVESILRQSGLKTGFYNSPHLVKVTERIRINCLPIEDEKFCEYFHEVYELLSIGTKRDCITMPSYFSFLTILAFYTFIREKVDCAVMEVGIGGEYDPTNIIQNPVACGITAIHFDHINILGNTIEDIAWSKAGILKPKVPVFTIKQEQNAAIKMIKSRAIEKNCHLYICESIKTNYELGIRGSIQYSNASLACQLARYFLGSKSENLNESNSSARDESFLSTDLDRLPDFYLRGLQNCSWPGRCQILTRESLTYFLDGAHTKESMENCISWFLSHSEELERDAYKVLIINIIGERNKIEILRPLAKFQDKFKLIVFSTNKISRAKLDNTNSETFSKFQNDKSIENAKNNLNTWNTVTNNDLDKQKKCVLIPNALESIELVKKISPQDATKKTHVLITGSLHFVGAYIEALSLVGKC